jgi:hypothetical protein
MASPTLTGKSYPTRGDKASNRDRETCVFRLAIPLAEGERISDVAEFEPSPPQKKNPEQNTRSGLLEVCCLKC